MAAPHEYELLAQDWQGRQVVLTKPMWQKISTLKHPEAGPYLSQIPVVLKRPTMVCDSRTDPSRLVFYRLGLTDGQYRHCYLAVVVDYSRQPAQVVTVYLPIEPVGRIGRVIHVAKSL